MGPEKRATDEPLQAYVLLAGTYEKRPRAEQARAEARRADAAVERVRALTVRLREPGIDPGPADDRATKNLLDLAADERQDRRTA